MRKSIVFIILLFAFTGNAQMRIVLNNNPYLVIENNTSLVIENSNQNAITTLGTGGNIVSEAESDLVKWNIGTSTGTYVIPFTTAAGFKIPLTFQVTSAGSGSGYIQFSTYGTNSANVPLPSSVTNIPIPLLYVDRFWRMDANGYATNPSSLVNFGYQDTSEIASPNTISEASLNASRYNPLTNAWEGTALGLANAGTNTVDGVIITPAELVEFWALFAPCIASITPSGPTTFCDGGNVILTANAGVAYQWFLNGNPISGATNATYTANASGDYTVQVTNAGGCIGVSPITTITVNLIPATPTASNTGAYCEGGSIQLNTSAVASASYSWTGPNGFTSSVQNPSLPATTLNSGIYEVTTTVNGCASAPGSTTVVVNPIPSTPVASNDGPNCVGTTIQLSTAAVAGATYAWTGPGGFTSNLQNPTLTGLTTAMTGVYNVTVTLNNCTSAVGTTTVAIGASCDTDGDGVPDLTDPNPTNPCIPTQTATPVASNNGPNCAGTTIQLSTPAVAGATYAWTGPGGFTSNLQNPTLVGLTNAMTGVYSVTVTLNNCTSAPGTTNVSIGASCDTDGDGVLDVSDPDPTNPCIPNQTATPVASNDGPNCVGTNIQLSTAAVAGATYAWTGPNGFTSNLQNPTLTGLTNAMTGVYSLTVTLNNCTSAAGTTTVAIGTSCDTDGDGVPDVSDPNPTNPCIPTQTATPVASNDGPNCVGTNIQLSTPAVAGATYAWTGPGGFTSNLQNPTLVGLTNAMAGTYSVTVTLNNCTSAAGTTIVAIGTSCDTDGDGVPDVSDPNPTNPCIPTQTATPLASNNGPNCAGTTIQLSTPAVAGATYAWTGPNGFTSSLPNPSLVNITTAMTGVYSVTVTVNNCTSAPGTTNVSIGTSCDTDGDGVPDVSDPNPTNPCIPNQTATPVASNDGPNCVGTNIQLSTPAVAGATYAWTGPNGFTSNLQNPTLTGLTNAMTGVYSLTVTLNNCTSAVGTTTVAIGTSCDTDGDGVPDVSDPNPTNPCIPAQTATPVANNDSPNCVGTTIQLSTAAIAGATYAWTGPGGFTSNLQNPTLVGLTNAMAGTYSLTVTLNNCTSAAGTTIVAIGTSCDTDGDGVPDVSDPNPTNPCIPTQTATPLASNNGPNCAGTTIQLSTPAVAGATYAWTGPGGFTSNLQNPTLVGLTNAMTGVYSVTVTLNNCTSAPGTTNVSIGASCDTDGDGVLDVSDPDPTNPCIPTQTATPSASNNGPNCVGTTIQFSTSAVAGATYAWTGPNGFTSALQNPTLNNMTNAMAGTYSLTVTLNNCTSAAGTTIVAIGTSCDTDGDGVPDVSDPNPTNPCIPTQTATPLASNNGPNCAGSTIQLSTASVAGAVYAWTGPNGFTSALQNPTLVGLTNAMTGVYSVTVTLNNCTSAPGTTNVSIGTSCDTDGDGIPDVLDPDPANPCIPNQTATPSASNDGPNCVGTTIQLSTPAVTGATYAWTGPNGFTSALQNPSLVNLSNAMTGVYSVTVTVNNCTSAPATTNVSIGASCDTDGDGVPDVSDPNPTNPCIPTQTATPSASNNGPNCVGTTIQLSTASVAGATYAWTGPNGFTSVLQNPTLNNLTNVMAGTYSVTVTLNNCTSAAGTTTVSIGLSCDTDGDGVPDVSDPNPTNPCIPNQTATPLASNNGPNCVGTTIQLSTASVSGATYAWTGPNGFTSTLQNPTVVGLTNAMTGVYSVTVTLNNCTSAPGTTNVSIGASCDTDGDGVPDISDPDPTNPCIPNQTPTPAVSYNSPLCVGNMLELTGTVQSGATLSWTGPNGFTSTMANPTISGVSLSEAGIYTLVQTVNNCTSLPATINVIVTANCDNDGDGISNEDEILNETDPNNPCDPFQTATPVAGLIDTICLGTTIEFSVNSVVNATYSWWGPASFSSAAQNPTIENATVQNSGTYYVTIEANNCVSDTVAIDVFVSTLVIDSDGDGVNDCVEGQQGTDPFNPCDPDNNSLACLLQFCGEEFIPSMFSPNQDGVNDLLFVHGDCVKSVDFKVFDRWGEVVFETIDPASGWDGNYKDKPMDTGVFSYVLLVELIDGSTKVERGNVTLVR